MATATKSLYPFAEEIKELRWKGKTNEQCAKIYGVTKAVMAYFCRINKFVINPMDTYSDLDAEDFPLIKELREGGMLLKELADKFDTTETTMSKHCRKHGIKDHPDMDIEIYTYADLMNSADAQKGEKFLIKRQGYEHYVCMPLSEYQKIAGGNNG